MTVNILAYFLTVLFVGLKLTGQIDWSWVWVASPVIIYWLAGLVVFVIILLDAASSHTQNMFRQ